MTPECSTYPPPPPPCEPPPPRPFRLECVIVCANYSDFLAYTLIENKILFDDLVVVTSPEDRRTQRLCEYRHVRCISTDTLETRWRKMCKGKGINVGLESLKLDGWVLHLDADIALPPLTRHLLAKADLDPTHLYGADRQNVPNHHEWTKFISSPRLQHEDECWLHMNQFPMGTRVAIHGYNGYIPLGFFQLWNPHASGIYRYPEGHETAAREDTKFALQWERRQRSLLPEVVCYHLESEKAPHGSNWDGRKTREFGPDAK